MSFVSGTLCSLCVPFYFLISGYLFFYGIKIFDFNIYIAKLRKRVKSLLVPYLLWNVIGLVCLVIKLLPIFKSYFPQYGLIELNFINIIKGFWSFSLISPSLVPYPYDFVLWFVRDLIIFNLLTPLFYIAAKYMKVVILTALIVLSVFNVGLPFLNPRMILFYFIGVLLVFNKVKLRVLYRTGKYLILPALAFAILSEHELIPDCSVFLFLYCITGIWSLSYIIYRLCVANISVQRKTTSSGFFVYAIHGLYVTISVSLVLHVIRPETSFGYICCYIVNFLLLYIVSSLMFYALRKLSPRFMSMLCGGRVC